MITDDHYKPLPEPCALCGAVSRVLDEYNWCPDCALLDANVAHLPQADGRPEVSNTGLLCQIGSEKQ